MSGAKAAGGVHLRGADLVTTFGAAAVELVVVLRTRVVGFFTGAGAGGAGGRPWMHCDLGRSHSSQ
ncbi:hypothetical protein GCM10007979_32340 [Nocardioides albus]|nr:hypothetical protein GCM10007979_32340 [Nocardioides albus]